MGDRGRFSIRILKSGAGPAWGVPGAAGPVRPRTAGRRAVAAGTGRTGVLFPPGGLEAGGTSGRPQKKGREDRLPAFVIFRFWWS